MKARLSFKSYKGFVHPEWNSYLKAGGLNHLDPRSSLVKEGLRVWAERLKDAFRFSGNSVQVKKSKHFMVFSSLESEELEQLLKRAEEFYSQFMSSPLKEIIDEDLVIPLILFRDKELMLDYTEHYVNLNNQNLGLNTAGFFLTSAEYPQIILHESDDYYAIERTLSHELTHFILRDFNLPVWIDEGLAMTFEHIHFPKEGGMNYFDIREAEATWAQRTNIKAFLSGKAWNYLRPEFTYGLSESLVQLLLEDLTTEEFINFLKIANYQDGGRKAFSTFYEGNLERYIVNLFKPGVEHMFAL